MVALTKVTSVPEWNEGRQIQEREVERKQNMGKIVRWTQLRRHWQKSKNCKGGCKQ